MGEVDAQIEAYRQKISELQQKLDAIPARLDEIKNQEVRINYAYAMVGRMSDEQYRKLISETEKARREANTQRAKYKEEMVHIEGMLKQAKEAREMNRRDDEEVFDNYSAILEKVSAIVDDAVRSDIVHRNIEKITVEKTTINQSFDKHPQGKEVLAKRITIYPYSRGFKEVFYFVPNDGKGGRMLSYVSLRGGQVMNIVPKQSEPRDISIDCFVPFDLNYLNRVRDEGKYQRREQIRANREALKSKAIDDIRKKGYISMNEMRLMSQLSYGTIYAAIHDGRLKGVNVLHTWYAKEKDFKVYLDKYKPQPRPYRQRHQVVIKEEGGDKS